MIKNEVDALTLQYFVNNKFERSLNPESTQTNVAVSNAEKNSIKNVLFS